MAGPRGLPQKNGSKPQGAAGAADADRAGESAKGDSSLSRYILRNS